jgi:3-hydroxyacyl-[acyl-carrier-protein] dehydratase
MKSNEILAFDLLPFRDYYRGQRASASASAGTTQGRPTSLPQARWRRSAFGAWPASTAPSQVGPLKDQPPEIQETTAPRHSARTAKRHSATRASKRRQSPATPKRRPPQRWQPPATPKGRPTQRWQPPATPKGRPTQRRRSDLGACPASTTKTRLLMLLNDLYTIDHLEAGTASATLRLNTEHPIFKGHFPDRPVLPGACQLQMIRELLSHITTKTYRLEKAAAVKFITPIDPRQNGTIRLNLQYGEEKHGGEKNTTLDVTATLIAGEAICLKFIGTFQAD